MALGKQVKKYREIALLTLEQLESLSGVDVGTISALERRDSEKSKYAGMLASAFGLSVEQLCDEDQEWPISVPIPNDRLPQSKSPVFNHYSAAENQPQPYLKNTGWPFRFSFSEFLQLSQADRDRIEAYISGIIETRRADAAAAKGNSLAA